MSKEELKPIDVSKYTVTENGYVIKGEELKSERIEALREKLRTELNKWWKKTFDVKREDDVCQVIKTKEAEDLCFDIALPREMQIDILSQHILELQADKGNLTDRVKELEAQIEQMKWHKLDWDKAEEGPDVDKLVRVRTRSGAEYICETYSYFPAEDEIGYGSVITQFSELNGDWVDDNEIEYWCYIEPFKEIKEN